PLEAHPALLPAASLEPEVPLAHAQALVTAFHQRFHGRTQVTPSPKELEHATALLAQYGAAKAHFLLAFAHQEAPATDYTPRGPARRTPPPGPPAAPCPPGPPRGRRMPRGLRGPPRRPPSAPRRTSAPGTSGPSSGGSTSPGGCGRPSPPPSWRRWRTRPGPA